MKQKQRFYLPADYATALLKKAEAAGVTAEMYLQHLISQDVIGPQVTQSNPPQASEPEKAITLSGDWASEGF